MADTAAFRRHASGHPAGKSSARQLDMPSPQAIVAIARARQRISLLLTGLVTAFDFLFALATGFAPSAMRLQVIPGLSWMMVGFLALVAFSLAMVGVYVFWAARYYDADWMLSHLGETGTEGGAL